MLVSQNLESRWYYIYFIIKYCNNNKNMQSLNNRFDLYIVFFLRTRTRVCTYVFSVFWFYEQICARSFQNMTFYVLIHCLFFVVCVWTPMKCKKNGSKNTTDWHRSLNYTERGSTLIEPLHTWLISCNKDLRQGICDYWNTF